jgi:hypothetical protein
MSDHDMIRRGDALMVATELALGRIQIDDVSDALHRLPAVDVAGVREEAVQAEREACALEAGNRKHWGYEDDEGHWDDHDPAQVGRQIQKAIRARKGGAA